MCLVVDNWGLWKLSSPNAQTVVQAPLFDVTYLVCLPLLALRRVNRIYSRQSQLPLRRTELIDEGIVADK